MNEIGFTVITITIALVIVFCRLPLQKPRFGHSPAILRNHHFLHSSQPSCALTLVPLLTSRFGKLEVPDDSRLWGRIMIWFENSIVSFGNWIANLLKWSLGHKRWIGAIVLALTLLVLALFPLGFIGFEFMPDVDQSEFSVILEMPKDISIEESSAFVSKAEAWLLDKPELLRWYRSRPPAVQNESTGDAVFGELNVKMVPPSQRSKSVSCISPLFERADRLFGRC